MSAAKRRLRSRPRHLLKVTIVLLVGALTAVLYLWWSRRADLPAAPVVDLAGVDPAVRRAVETARTAVVQSPHSADAWGRLGMVLLSHGLQVETSNACFAQAERLDPSQPSWPYLHATSLALSDPEAAIPKLQRAAELCGSASDMPRLQLADLLLDQGRLAEAEDQFRRVLQQQPASAPADLGLGRLAFERGDLSESICHLNRCVQDAHTRKASHALLAQIRERQGDKPAAEQELRQAADLPNDAAWPDPFLDEVRQIRTGKQTFLTRADHLIHQGRYKEALASLRQTVRDYPDSGWAWVMLGRTHLGMGNLPAAEQVLRKAIQLAPEVAEAHFYLGVALFLQKNHPEAAACFRKTIDLKPGFALAHYNLGHCLKEQGDRAGAVAEFRITINCNPGYAPAHVNLGGLLLKNGQSAEALVPLRHAVGLNPADPEAKKLLEQVLKQIAIPTGP